MTAFVCIPTMGYYSLYATLASVLAQSGAYSVKGVKVYRSKPVPDEVLHLRRVFQDADLQLEFIDVDKAHRGVGPTAALMLKDATSGQYDTIILGDDVILGPRTLSALIRRSNIDRPFVAATILMHDADPSMLDYIPPVKIVCAADARFLDEHKETHHLWQYLDKEFDIWDMNCAASGCLLIPTSDGYINKFVRQSIIPTLSMWEPTEGCEDIWLTARLAEHFIPRLLVGSAKSWHVHRFREKGLNTNFGGKSSQYTWATVALAIQGTPLRKDKEYLKLVESYPPDLYNDVLKIVKALKEKYLHDQQDKTPSVIAS